MDSRFVLSAALVAGLFAGSAVAQSAPPAAQATEAEPSADAEAARLKACADALVAIGHSPAKRERANCARLLSVLQARILARQLPGAKMELLEPIQTGNQSSGAGAQSTPVPSAAPASVAAGTVGLAGTRTGTKAVTVLSVNPLSIAASPDEAATPAFIATAARLADLTLTLPISTGALSAGGAPPSAFDYVGVRLRVNAFAFLSGPSVVEQATARAKAYGVKLSEIANNVQAALDSAPDVVACARGIAADDVAAIKTGCGKEVVIPTAAEDYAGYLEELETVRWNADRQYLGADLRSDFGDPTFSGDPALRGTSLLASMGYGVRLGRPGSFAMLRTRLGAVYSQLQGGETPVWSVDYGVAVEWGAIANIQSFRFGVGLEGRRSMGAAGVADTNFTDLKLGLGIPLSDRSTISVGFSLPLGANNPHAPVLTMSGDW
ncbi:MAG TPA: hypothetical protein VK420_19125, partial [Longimicrobium sp.]|nr:hypothetical protein [Longimicrobium sp.]